jgi:hypothetical protein
MIAPPVRGRVSSKISAAHKRSETRYNISNFRKNKKKKAHFSHLWEKRQGSQGRLRRPRVVTAEMAE